MSDSKIPEKVEQTIMWPVIKKILLWTAIAIPVLLVGSALLIYLSLPDVGDLMTNNPRTTALMLQRFREAPEQQLDQMESQLDSGHPAQV